MAMDDLFGSGSGGGPNEVVTKRVDEFSPGSSTAVGKIYLRGSWTTGQHQEILCEVGDNFIRLSRTNGSDTIQYGARWEHKIQMPVLEETKLVGKTVGDVVQAFEDAHDSWPRYEQADCQAFAQRIFKRLAGYAPSGGGDDDDFM